MSLKPWIRLVRIWGKRISRFLTHDIWNLNMEDFSRWRRFWIGAYTMLVASINDFSQKKIGIMSASLSYFCTLAFVPFLAVCFALTDGFGMGEIVQEFLNENVADPQILAILTSSAENIIDSAKSGGFGLVNALMFIWLVIWMMMRVEKVFNDVWDVPEDQREGLWRNVKKTRRNFFKSFSIDLTILLFAPFLVVFFFVGTLGYSRLIEYFPKYNRIFSYLESFLGWVIFAAVAVMIFSAMYKFIPTAKVRYKNALKSAIVAGIAFTGLQYLYLETQLLVTRINAVYGAIASIPLFLIWLRFGWLIIMLGAQLSFSLQNPGLIKAKAQK